METAQYYLNSFGDRYLYDVNRGAFNQIGAANVFKKRFGEALFDKDSLTLIVGTDSGLLVRYVQQHGVPDGARFVFLELAELLPTIREELADIELDEHILLVGHQDFEATIGELQFSDYANIGAVRLIDSVGAGDDFLGGYRNAFAAIRQQLDAILWLHTVQMSNPSFVRRQLENLIEQHVPAQALRGRFAGMTAALLGGGPSLDEILPWIREHQQELVIIAVSRVCRRLREADVVPHIVVSIDPTELSFDISKEFLELNPKVILAHANHVNFPLLAQWRGRSVFLDRRYPWVCKDEPANIAAAGPTVTNTGFALAEAMGFGTIVFAGIDMCHSAEGFSHARGSNEFDAGPMLGIANMRVPTNSGRMAETTPDFFNAINAFSAQAQHAQAAGIAVINPAPGAAVMKGVTHVPLDQLQLPQALHDPFERLHQCLDGDHGEQRLGNLRAMQRELARAHDQLRKIIQLAEEALACNDGLFGRTGKPADFRHKKRMDKIERKLDTRYKGFSEIVRMFSAQAFLHMPPSDREWTDDEIEQAGQTYYRAYRDNAQRILALVEQAQYRLGSAESEESATPDFARLLKQWQDDEVPGRAIAWAYRHPGQLENMPVEVQAQFEALEKQFREVLSVRDTSHARKMRAEAALGPVRGKLQLLFKERNLVELHNIAEQLAKQNGDEAAQLHRLACGYLAELDGDNEKAFGHYNDLIDLVRDALDGSAAEQPNPRLEDALRRMVVIAMAEQWHDHALLILETLSGIAPAYEPQFAELLRLSGNVEAAINVYTDYLSKAPGDHAAMLRLGKLYQTIGSLDAARTAFTYVLEHDPDNKAAQSLLQQTGTAA